MQNIILVLVLFVVFVFAYKSFYSKNKNISQYTTANNIVEKVKVLRVVDGDTIKVLLNGKKERVRILGINSLELTTNSKLALLAKQELEKLLKNQKVDLHINPLAKKDKYKRLLAKVYVSSNKTWVEGYMLKNGLAVAYPFSNYGFNKQELYKQEEIAKTNKVGIWQNTENTIINAKNASHYIDLFKIANGRITQIKHGKNKTIITLESSLNVVIDSHVKNLKVGNYISVRGKIRPSHKYGLRVFSSLDNIKHINN